MIIVVTGKFGSGKSTVSKIIAKHGFRLISADKLGHDVLNENKNKIIKEFGTSVLNKHKKIGRKKLAEIVFNNEHKLKRLNKITHNQIIRKIKKQIKKNKNCVVDAALFYELKLNKIADCVILIRAKKTKKLERLKYDKRFINKISGLQKEPKKYHFLVNNNSKLGGLRKQIRRIIKNAKNSNLSRKL